MIFSKSFGRPACQRKKLILLLHRRQVSTFVYNRGRKSRCRIEFQAASGSSDGGGVGVDKGELRKSARIDAETGVDVRNVERKLRQHTKTGTAVGMVKNVIKLYFSWSPTVEQNKLDCFICRNQFFFKYFRVEQRSALKSYESKL